MISDEHLELADAVGLPSCAAPGHEPAGTTDSNH